MGLLLGPGAFWCFGNCKTKTPKVKLKNGKPQYIFVSNQYYLHKKVKQVNSLPFQTSTQLLNFIALKYFVFKFCNLIPASSKLAVLTFVCHALMTAKLKWDKTVQKKP